MRQIALATVVLSALAACAGTNTGMNYLARAGFEKAKSDDRFTHLKGAPALYAASIDPETDLRRLAEDGYVLIGTASFSTVSTKTMNEQAVSQAKAVGASIVLLHSQPKAVAASPVAAPVVRADGPLETYGANPKASDASTASGAAPAGASGHSASDSLDVIATFWIRQEISKIHFGANVTPLPAALRARMPHRLGMYVKSVVRGTPAAEAGIRPGDVLLRISGLDVADSSSLKDQIEMFSGLSTEIELARDDKVMTVTVQLRP